MVISCLSCAISLQAGLGSKWIHDVEKRELIEISITRADARDAVFAHENGRMRVVQQVACKMWQL